MTSVGAEIVAQIKEMRSDPKPAVRRKAADAFGRLPDDLALPLMLRAALDEDATVSGYALEQIDKLPGGRKNTVFRQVLYSPAPGPKSRVLGLLGENRSTEAFGIVLNGFIDPDPAVVAAAKEAGNRLTGRSFEDFGAANLWWSENETFFEATAPRTP